VHTRVWQPKSPQPPLKHGFKLFDKCKKSGIYKFFKLLPKVPCGTIKEIERVSERPFGVPLLQQSSTNSTQKEKKNEKDFLGKKDRILKYQCLTIELIRSEERQHLSLTSELSLELVRL